MLKLGSRVTFRTGAYNEFIKLGTVVATFRSSGDHDNAYYIYIDDEHRVDAFNESELRLIEDIRKGDLVHIISVPTNDLIFLLSYQTWDVTKYDPETKLFGIGFNGQRDPIYLTDDIKWVPAGHYYDNRY